MACLTSTRETLLMEELLPLFDVEDYKHKPLSCYD